MATYAIGDIQGCWRSLERLLEALPWEPGHDRLWLAGDLVNRGPGSLEVLRWAASFGDDRLVAVLGNHDLHLLCAAEGVRELKSTDTLQGILDAPDRDDLLAWLWQRPLVHREGEHLMVHAGLLPQWTPEDAERLADQAHAMLCEEGGLRSLRSLMPTDETRVWDPVASAEIRAATVLNVMTRIRCLDAEGRLREDYAGPLETMPEGLIAWHEHAERQSDSVTVVCGHWAAQGLLMRDRLIALDSGCVWGGRLTAVRLDDRAVFSVPAAEGTSA